MDRKADSRTLRLMEGYLTDLICEGKDARQVEMLTATLISVREELMRLEGNRRAVAQAS
jgi:hypothetical protein